jgi:hypothetical protein
MRRTVTLLLLLQAVDESLTPHLLSDSYHMVAFVYTFVKSLHASMFKLTLREKIILCSKII